MALLGFTLRSKILFPLHFLDYSGLLSAHSHFAFAGWAGLSLITLFIYDILPEELWQRKIYQWALTAIEVSALGMAFLFPFFGYNFATIAFSTLYVLTIFVFVPVFIKDVARTPQNNIVRLLSISALVSLLLSFLGTLGLMYIIISRSGGSLLYRDSIYTFLHFQYNGFFTLSVFALFMNYVSKKGVLLNNNARMFSVMLCLSILPALFLSLLWHDKTVFYFLAAIACFCILTALFYFYLFLKSLSFKQIFTSRVANTFWTFSVISFVLKMMLQVGTIFPRLGNAVYGDRPVIIGFLHLVFLGFVSFFVLAVLIEKQHFSIKNRIVLFPFIIFSAGIILNEFLLMLQGLGILFQTNNDVYKWLLWMTAIILFTGALLIALTSLRIISIKKTTLSDGSDMKS
ncbi:MAG TPA: hypothetical protein VLI68_04345 [Hanamia sp.]|nr:hypothetical protein [Hanamia sp.]